VNLAIYYLKKPEFENQKLIGKALLKIAYLRGKTDAEDYLIQYNLVRDID